MPTQPYISKSDAKVLVIGHDPKLQKSNTVADFSLFADYYFRPEPKSSSEKRKYELAKAVFNFILKITKGKISKDEICVTNLCNEDLPHAPKGKTVYIPQEQAMKGIREIRDLLSKYPSIKIIFPMSLQVNYWLQKLNFYIADSDFVRNSEPILKGINNSSPYFEATKKGTFLGICGNEFKVPEFPNITVFPVLYIKSYPPKGRFMAYRKNYSGLSKKVLKLL